MKTKSLSEEKGCCCSSGTSKAAELILPVAPRAVVRSRFASSEKLARPIPPAGAMAWLKEYHEQGAEIKGVKIDGPGDPLAESGPTMEILDLLKQNYRDVTIELITAGMYGEKYARGLATMGVSHVTILVDALDAETASKLCAWIRPGKKTFPLAEAANILIEQQEKSVKAFIDAGCNVSIRTTVYPGFNNDQIVKIAETFSAYGAKEMSLVPFQPAPDGQDIMPDPPDETLMHTLAELAGQHMNVSVVSRQDVVGFGMDCASPSSHCTADALLPHPSKNRPNVAVASLQGIEVDLHLGQAWQFMIYGPREDGLSCLLETRPAPELGAGDVRWQTLAEALSDCFALLASGAGTKPRQILGDQGITVIVTEDNIEGTVDVLFGGGKKKKR